MEKNMRLNATENMPRPNEPVGSTDHVVDYASQSGSTTLLPMLIAGIVMIIIGMIVVAATS